MHQVSKAPRFRTQRPWLISLVSTRRCLLVTSMTLTGAGGPACSLTRPVFVGQTSLCAQTLRWTKLWPCSRGPSSLVGAGGQAPVGPSNRVNGTTAGLDWSWERGQGSQVGLRGGEEAPGTLAVRGREFVHAAECHQSTNGVKYGQTPAPARPGLANSMRGKEPDATPTWRGCVYMNCPGWKNPERQGKSLLVVQFPVMGLKYSSPAGAAQWLSVDV